MDDALVRTLMDEPAFEQAWFDNQLPCIFNVDWREEDSAIVELCAEAAGLADLRAEWDDEDLVIGYRGTDTVLRLSPDDGVGNRDTTVRRLNVLLAPEYEIRLVVLSHGSDEASFCVLPAADWATLEQEHTQAVEENFLRLDGLPNIFTEMTEVHLPLPAKQRFYRLVERNKANKD